MYKKLISVFLAIYAIAFYFEWDDKVYTYVLSEINSYQGKNRRIDLHQYQVSIQAKKINEIQDNLSGITYNKHTKTLFAVTNRPQEIFELDTKGNLLRTITLNGFKDTEGITYIKKNTFAIVDERKSSFYLLEITPHTKEINRQEVKRVFNLNLNSFKNLGYEGIAYNAKEDMFILVNEMFPLSVVKIKNWMNSPNSIEIKYNTSIDNMKYNMVDYSGVYFDSVTNHLLILSHESQLVAEIDSHDESMSFTDLEGGFMGLHDDIPQAEGITMDENRTIYIVSEPNLFYKFQKEES